MINYMIFCYHFAKAERLLNEHGKCMDKGDNEKAEKLWTKHIKHQRKLIEIMKKVGA